MFPGRGKLIRCESGLGACYSRIAATIGLRPTLVVIAAATLTFAQTPNSHKRAADSCDVTSTNTTASQSSQSLVEAVPTVLPLFNNGPVFGRPGTVERDFWHRTQLIGDPDCKRTDLSRRGVFIDMYATSAYQQTVSGGLKTGRSIVQNTQL